MKTCGICLLLHLLFGLPLALWGSRSRSILCRSVSFLVTLPLVFPPIALGYLLLRFLGRNSLIGDVLEQCCGIRVVFSEIGVVMAAFVVGLPLVVRPLQAALKSENIIRLEQAARVTGCGPLKTFFFVTLPLIRTSLASGLLLGTARASGEVGVTMMLGGNISWKTNTLSLEVFNRVSRGELEEASQLCFLLAITGLILYVVLEKLQSKRVI
ncbi:MAG: ABC transporter permease subunit [Smithellaceae bacterium]|nr:ABC transporter permease subunit [Smithellaceae bacterium]